MNRWTRSENLPAVYQRAGEPSWPRWASLSNLRPGIGRSRFLLNGGDRWKFPDICQSVCWFQKKNAWTNIGKYIKYIDSVHSNCVGVFSSLPMLCHIMTFQGGKTCVVGRVPLRRCRWRPSPTPSELTISPPWSECLRERHSSVTNGPYLRKLRSSY